MNFRQMKDGTAQGVFNSSNIILPGVGKKSYSALQLTAPTQADLAHTAPSPDVKKIINPGTQNESLVTTYRTLSKSYVYQMGWFGLVCISFAHDNVLKDSMPKIVGRPIMPDHSNSSQEWLGRLTEASWANSINNLDVPGINGVVSLDIDPDVTHPSRRIVRGVEQGVLNCFSVSVWFRSARSHPDMDIDIFYDSMGQPGPDGAIICFVAEEILSYTEGSVVLAGADPNAVQKELSQTQDQHNVLCAFSSADGWSFTKEKTHMPTKKDDMVSLEKFQEIEAQVADLESKNEDLSSQVAEKDTKVSELAAQIVEGSEALETLKQENANLSATHEEAQAALTEAQGNIETLQGTVDANTELLSAAQESLAALQSEFDSYKADTQEKVELAEKTEADLRADTERVYLAYTGMIQAGVSDKTKQTRLKQIKETWNVEELAENRGVWQEEIEHMLQNSKSAEHDPKKVVDKDPDGLYTISKSSRGTVK